MYPQLEEDRCSSSQRDRWFHHSVTLRVLMTRLKAHGLRPVGSSGNICVIIYLSIKK